MRRKLGKYLINLEGAGRRGSKGAPGQFSSRHGSAGFRHHLSDSRYSGPLRAAASGFRELGRYCLKRIG